MDTVCEKNLTGLAIVHGVALGLAPFALSCPLLLSGCTDDPRLPVHSDLASSVYSAVYDASEQSGRTAFVEYTDRFENGKRAEVTAVDEGLLLRLDFSAYENGAFTRSSYGEGFPRAKDAADNGKLKELAALVETIAERRYFDDFYWTCIFDSSHNGLDGSDIVGYLLTTRQGEHEILRVGSVQDISDDLYTKLSDSYQQVLAAVDKQ